MNSSFSKHHPLFLQSFLWLLLWNVVLLERCSYGTFSQLFQKQNWNYHCIRNKLHILLSNLPASTELSFNGRSLTQFRPVTEDTVRCTILGSLSKTCEQLQTTSLHFWHQNLPHTFHKNKDLWTTSFFFHGPDRVELVTVWCSSLSVNIVFQAGLKNSSLQICI